MTFVEFQRTVEGYLWKRERDRRDTAWALSNVINACGWLKKGHRVKPDDFVPPVSSTKASNAFFRLLMGVPKPRSFGPAGPIKDQ
jgi:hypothetical protein